MRELSGKSEARGRNGWFKPAKFQSWSALGGQTNTDFGGPILFEVWSKQEGRMAPIIMWLTIEDARDIVGMITNAIIDAGGFEQKRPEIKEVKVVAEIVEGVSFPWCEACRSYHHPKNPTCKAVSGR
jgi:hypothetical protein